MVRENLKWAKNSSRRFYDNQATISIAKNLVHYDKTKHVKIDHHFIKDKTEELTISLVFVSNYSLENKHPYQDIF